MQISGTSRCALAGLSLFIGCSLPIGTSLSAEDAADLDVAEIALARGEFARALISFDRVLEANPNERRALLGSARANLSLRRGAASLALFDAYRERPESGREMDPRDYCAAIALAAEQAIESGERVGVAHVLTERLETEHCADAITRDLILRSGLEVAAQALEQGQEARALEIYLSLVSDAPDLDQSSRTDTGVEESALARAYLAASEILVMQGRREEALALLSGGLAKFPKNRDLVHRILTVLADGSSVVFPRAKPPEESQPAAPD